MERIFPWVKSQITAAWRFPLCMYRRLRVTMCHLLCQQGTQQITTRQRWVGHLVAGRCALVGHFRLLSCWVFFWLSSDKVGWANSHNSPQWMAVVEPSSPSAEIKCFFSCQEEKKIWSGFGTKSVCCSASGTCQRFTAAQENTKQCEKTPKLVCLFFCNFAILCNLKCY